MDCALSLGSEGMRTGFYSMTERFGQVHYDHRPFHSIG
jgi:hypothetical protein